MGDRPSEGDVTLLLKELSGGNQKALEDLVPLVYEELRVIARHQLVGEAEGHTLNATAIVHEAYVRLAKLDRIEWQDRAHFFAIASQAIRRVLVDYAIRRNAIKRGGGRKRVDLTKVPLFEDSDADAVLALNQALERLRALDDRQVRVVECRFFGGMSIEETALALDVSKATVKRDWVLARAWLNRELSDG
ncbi:MAG: sigma-70 family RNA polymerase sigma factor [Gemmatimonadetes bacterium]|nr:sigma-70 family RNA polymerase sigma factor [Gemmatimonadota bacterium]